MAVAWIVAIVGVAGVVWWVHVLLFPWRDCPRCGGKERIKSGYAHRDCGRCGSKGRVRRIGAGKES